MRNSLKVVTSSAFSVMFSVGLRVGTYQRGEVNVASDTSAQQIAKEMGVVKDVDLSSKEITISCEAILVAGRPAMTTRFTFVNADDSIMVLKAGTHADPTFVQQGNISLLKGIDDTQS